ncbi:MAG: PDZ domain-containing protein [Alphaproteobacteria bacterium]|nr:PDZ domain-containing protein [Alphaproteobacteria bacterium]MCB9697162.1 PDZ domain-containing protein [Alphaproteobacteria bacterium]
MTTLDLDAPIEAQLDPGSAPRTFRLACQGHVTWAGAPAWPVTVTLTNDVDAAAATVVVSSDATFRIEAEVGPGVWHVSSDVSSEADGSWWSSLGPFLDVEASGRVSCVSNCIMGLHHVRKMALSGPARGEVVTEARPVLGWEPVPGADHYGVRWFELPTESGRMKPAEPVRGTTWTFPFDVVQGRVYQWDAEAYDASGERIARMGGSFRTPGGEVVRTWPATWLGVNPVDVPGRGVVVGAVVPDSPAARAGLRAGVVVVSYRGRSLASANELRAAIADTPAGTVVELVVRDDEGVETTLRPTIEARARD